MTIPRHLAPHCYTRTCHGQVVIACVSLYAWRTGQTRNDAVFSEPATLFMLCAVAAIVFQLWASGGYANPVAQSSYTHCLTTSLPLSLPSSCSLSLSLSLSLSTSSL